MGPTAAGLLLDLREPVGCDLDARVLLRNGVCAHGRRATRMRYAPTKIASF